MLRRRTFLLAAALALLLWLRPWRWFARSPQPMAAGGAQRPDAGGGADTLSPADVINTWRPATAGDQPVIAPEAAFATPPQADLDWQSEPATTAADDQPVIAPEAAFATHPQADLDWQSEPATTAADDQPVIAPEAAFAAHPQADLDWQSEPAATAADEERLQSSPDLAADAGMFAVGDEAERAVGEPPRAPDDLLVIEGIGPKVSTIVTAAGITSFAALATATAEQLQTILREGGIETLDPSTWPAQARLADEGRWDELKALQERIHDGRIS